MSGSVTPADWVCRRPGVKRDDLALAYRNLAGYYGRVLRGPANVPPKRRSRPVRRIAWGCVNVSRCQFVRDTIDDHARDLVRSRADSYLAHTHWRCVWLGRCLPPTGNLFDRGQRSRTYDPLAELVATGISISSPIFAPGLLGQHRRHLCSKCARVRAQVD
jgi:hypothetical protein